MKRSEKWLAWLAVVFLVILLVPLPLWADDDSDSDSDEDASPVGAWAVYYTDPAGESNTMLNLFDRGGTVTGAAWTDPWTNPAGAWKQVAENRYLSTFYLMIPDLNGILKIREEFWMLSKDEMEGRSESWWVPGSDPLGEEVALIFHGTTVYRRIKAEP